MRNEQRSFLREMILTETGPWTTSRVMRVYRSYGVDAPVPAMAREDLRELAREGLLLLDTSNPDRWHYTRKDNRR